MKKHLNVSAALIFKDGKMFAAKRGESPFAYVAHKYEFPGGKIEEGESGAEAVKRELKEELDLDAKVGGLFGVTSFEYPDFTVTLSLYECEPASDFVLKEHENYAWFSPRELKEEDFAPADAEFIAAIKRIFGE